MLLDLYFILTNLQRICLTSTSSYFKNNYLTNFEILKINGSKEADSFLEDSRSFQVSEIEVFSKQN